MESISSYLDAHCIMCVVFINILGNVHLLSEGDGSKSGGSTKIVEGRKGDVHTEKIGPHEWGL